MVYRVAPVLVLAAAALVGLGGASAGAAEHLALRAIGTESVDSVAPGPHGRVWAAIATEPEPAADGIHQIERRCPLALVDPGSGHRTDVSYPTEMDACGSLLTAAGGAAWLSSGRGVARVTSSGASRITALRAEPTRLVVASDGAAWASFADGSRLERITAGGTVATIELPAPRTPGAAAVTALAAGRDGTVWALRVRDVVSIDRRGRATVYGGAAGTTMAVGHDGWPWTVGGAALAHLGPHGWRSWNLAGARGDGVLVRDGRTMRLVELESFRMHTIAPDGHVRVATGPPTRQPQTSARTSVAVSGGRLFVNGVRLYELVDGSPCWVPDVTGASEAAARTALARAGCRVRVRRTRVERGVPAVVTAQRQPVDRVLSGGSRVQLTVGSPTACTAPPYAYEAFSSPTVRVYRRNLTQDGETTSTYWACLASTRQARQIYEVTGSSYGDASTSPVGFAAAGTWLGIGLSAGGRGDTTGIVERIDLSRPGGLEPVSSAAGRSVVGLALAPGGDVAWVAASTAGPAEIHVLHGGQDRVVGTVPLQGAALIGLRLDATTVSWTSSDGPKSAPISP